MGKKKHKSNKSRNEKIKREYSEIILRVLRESDAPISYSKLRKRCNIKDHYYKRFAMCVNYLKKERKISKLQDGFILMEKVKPIKCEVVKLTQGYGFVRDCETDEDIYVNDKHLLGAMPGDIVLVRPITRSSVNTSGDIIKIQEENFSKFIGNIVLRNGEYVIELDSISNFEMKFVNPLGIAFKENDKVMAVLSKRGKNYSEHRCELVSNFGSSLKASCCAISVLELNGVSSYFPENVISEAKAVSDEEKVNREIQGRVDLRDLPIFTIDGADTKDIDDAISVVKTKSGFELGVHIADVSHYVKQKSALDNEAFNRGTSVYYANKVVPMLPKELSNGICSLNPNADRLAFSCIMNIDKNGVIKSYKFEKSVIRSRVQGVYSEINKIISGEADNEIKAKYSEVMDIFPDMLELFRLLDRNKKARGCPNIETSESRLIINDNDECIGVEGKTRGVSEDIIENFMLAANECAAKFGTENDLPFVYRIHEIPPMSKEEYLFEGLTKLGIPFNSNDKVTARFLSDILTQSKGTPKSAVVNSIVLKSMAKARYSVEPIGHFGLVLENYAHFTSPIRRYPDLTIHRIMSEYLENPNHSEIERKYNKFTLASADRSSKREITAMLVERECESFYKAEYLSNHIGEVFNGVITSVKEFGFYVELENTCEGLVRVESLQDGYYEYDGLITLRNELTGQSFMLGDAVKVKVANASVSSGKVDFELSE